MRPTLYDELGGRLSLRSAHQLGGEARRFLRGREARQRDGYRLSENGMTIQTYLKETAERYVELRKEKGLPSENEQSSADGKLAIHPAVVKHDISTRHEQEQPSQPPTVQAAVEECLKEQIREIERMGKTKDQRLKTLSKIRNPFPEVTTQERAPSKKKKDPILQLPEAQAAPIPHDIFSERLRTARGEKHIRSLLSHQLSWCSTPEALIKVIATALLSGPRVHHHLAALHAPITRALYRCRSTVHDSEILRTITCIYGRYKVYNVTFDQQLLYLALKFAARTRSLRLMKKYLKVLRETGEDMSSNLFRAIVAKFSIGHRGLGEIRNGRWKRSELHQVCVGFSDCEHLPPEKQYHLGVWLVREDWQFLHGWLAVLARCGDVERLWHEWELWKKSPARVKPKKLMTDHVLGTTKDRGDYWLVEQMTYSGGLKEAWTIFGESNIPFSVLSDRIKMRMLEGAQYATVWNECIRKEMLRKYDFELKKIEKALGLRWVSASKSGEGCDAGEDGEGRHIPIEDQEDVLERLSADDWKLEEKYGYPDEDEEAERRHPHRRKPTPLQKLHRAEEA
jgi:hypothetical protein